MENFFNSLKLKDISGLAYLAERGDLYEDLSTTVAHIFALKHLNFTKKEYTTTQKLCTLLYHGPCIIVIHNKQYVSNGELSTSDERYSNFRPHDTHQVTHQVEASPEWGTGSASGDQ